VERIPSHGRQRLDGHLVCLFTHLYCKEVNISQEVLMVKLVERRTRDLRFWVQISTNPKFQFFLS
jgi:hypothetical protein